VTAASKPTGPLTGLVLAGGASRRMGRDKGLIEVGGRPQVERCVALFSALGLPALVSTTRSQAAALPYSGLPLVLDDGRNRGPAAGLLAAWGSEPGIALLVLAVDMLLVDREVLSELIARRRPDRAVTAYRNAQGLIEPLCAIWEPRAAALLAAASRPSPSLRRIVEGADAELIEAPWPDRLVSANTPAQLRAAERSIRGADAGPGE